MELRSDLIRATLLGLIILGIGGRLLMRVVAHMEGRPPVFIAICMLVAWRGVSGLLPIPQAMFMALALAYLIIVDVLGRRRTRRVPTDTVEGDQVQAAF